MEPERRALRTTSSYEPRNSANSQVLAVVIALLRSNVLETAVASSQDSAQRYQLNGEKRNAAIFS
jgi:hypothetical protein